MSPQNCYRPQTKFAKVMFLQVCVCPQGGMRASGGVCVLLGVCAWLGGMHGCRGVCVVVGGHVWLQGGVRTLRGVQLGCREGMHGIWQDTVNERVVRILLECILVLTVYLCFSVSVCCGRTSGARTRTRTTSCGRYCGRSPTPSRSSYSRWLSSSPRLPW